MPKSYRPIAALSLLAVRASRRPPADPDTRAWWSITAALSDDAMAGQRDPEPERGLLRRADHWPFLEAGVPATAFVFGSRSGSESERLCREWYRTGDHRPQDDLGQPIDRQAVTDFNRFFYAFATRVADQPGAPAWKPGSALRTKP